MNKLSLNKVLNFLALPTTTQRFRMVFLVMVLLVSLMSTELAIAGDLAGGGVGT